MISPLPLELGKVLSPAAVGSSTIAMFPLPMRLNGSPPFEAVAEGGHGDDNSKVCWQFKVARTHEMSGLGRPNDLTRFHVKDRPSANAWIELDVHLKGAIRQDGRCDDASGGANDEVDAEGNLTPFEVYSWPSMLGQRHPHTNNVRTLLWKVEIQAERGKFLLDLDKGAVEGGLALHVNRRIEGGPSSWKAHHEAGFPRRF